MNGFVRVEIKVPALVRQEGEWFISHCPVLDVTSQGKTNEEALSNLVEALQLFVQTCFEMGTLGEVLRDCGFKPDGGEKEDEDGNMISVPLSLVAHRAENHAH